MCPYCGHDYRVPTYSYPQQETISSGLRAVFYILSILIPLAGIIIGIIYYAKPDPDSKRVGKNCIIIAITVWVAAALLTVAMFIVLSGSLSVFSMPCATIPGLACWLANL